MVSMSKNGRERREFHRSRKRENPLTTLSESEKNCRCTRFKPFHMACWILRLHPQPPQVEIGCDALTPAQSFQPATGPTQQQGPLTQRQALPSWVTHGLLRQNMTMDNA